MILSAHGDPASLPPATPPDFDREVAAIFASRCFDCHNTNEHKGDLDLTHRETAMKGGEDGVVIVEGRPGASELWINVSENKMPPKHPLPEAEKDLLKRWIASGAKWGTDPIDPFRFTTAKRAGYDWWSLQALKKAAPPAVKQANWTRNPIDAFILAELEKMQLAPSPEADKRTLIRRITFDLLGLPPTPEQVETFVNDAAPDAYDKLVERLLASPDYGVRWARHWLDLVRFGESNGFERDQHRPNAWRYRDWVVDALNADMPYRQFVRMQLAGDLIEPKTADGIIATGAIVGGAYDEVGNGQQSLAMRAVVRQDEMEDIVSMVSQTFLGMTANCARCHDHKFDPIAQREYYQLASSLSGVRYGERELPADTIRDKTQAYNAATNSRIAELQSRIDGLENPIRDRLLAERKNQKREPPKPFAEWRFADDLQDHIGSLHVTVNGDAALVGGALKLGGKGYALSAPLQTDLKEKSLEASVSLRDLQQRGGGVIGVQTLDGNRFDGIVFAERVPGRWMAGSDAYNRYKPFEGAEEKEAATAFVQITIVYQADGTITGYRNGKSYGASYKSISLAPFAAGKSQIIFGLRHSPAGNGKFLIGAIKSAKLYDRALTPDEVAASAGTIGVGESEIAAALTAEQRELIKTLRFEIQAIRAQQNRAGSTRTYACVPAAPGVTKLLLRGNTTREGPAVNPGGIASVSGVSADFGLKPDAPDADRRVKLADWITDPANPLFSRVIVNRLWLYHFGNGIVETPNDFGFNGGRPSHPELLDWLAAQLSSEGWSLKKMHRLMVTSATYRQQSLPRPEAMKVDASNRLMWRMNPRRVEAEALRDTILSVACELNPALGGPGYEDYYTFTNNTTFYEARDYVGSAFARRSLYRTWIRSGRNPLLDVFDCPDPSTKTPRRAVTTTPLQALALMNDSFIFRMSDSLAARVKSVSGEDVARQISEMYRRTILRLPTPQESEEATAFVQKHGLAAFARIMLNSSEFVSVD